MRLNLWCEPAGGGVILEVSLFMSEHEVWLETYFYKGMEPDPTIDLHGQFSLLDHKKTDKQVGHSAAAAYVSLSIWQKVLMDKLQTGLCCL